jgi:hypothetical protein
MSTTIPMIHLNGTSAKALKEEILTAIEALAFAQAALEHMTVNARDHYPKSDKSSFASAQAEHRYRLSSLGDVMSDLSALYEGIVAQEG